VSTSTFSLFAIVTPCGWLLVGVSWCYDNATGQWRLPVKILAAKPNWYQTFDNYPHMQILVDAIPKTADMRFEKRGDLYFAESDGYVMFYAYHSPGEGYGGAQFHLTMKDGSTAVLKGPWSSRPAQMNLAGFTPSCDVEITSEPAAFERGYTFMAGHVTLAVLREACKLAGLHAVEWNQSYYPSLLPGGVVKLWQSFGGKVVARWMDYGKVEDETVRDSDLSNEQISVVRA